MDKWRRYRARSDALVAARRTSPREIIASSGVGASVMDGDHWLVDVPNSNAKVVLSDATFRALFEPDDGESPDGWG